jgi:hypothetical protein
MRRLEGRGLSLGTVTERNAPESLTRIVLGSTTATCSVDSHGSALDQVGLRCQRARTKAHLLIARVESEAGESQAKTYTVTSHSSFRGAPLRASPESRGRTRVPGAMQHAALRGVMLRRTGTVTGADVRDGPGSAVHGRPHCVLATRGGVAWVTNWVASSMPMPSGVGISIRNGTSTRVPAIGANQASMLRWAARYLIAARSGM